MILNFRQSFASNMHFPSEMFYLIVFTLPRDRFNACEIDSIFADCYKRSMLNVNILFPYTKASMMMTTYRPFEGNCRQLVRRDLGIFTGTQSTLSGSLANVYPPKALNMNKCKLTVATFASEPLVIVRSLNETTYEAQVDGVEVELINELARVLNFVAVFKLPADKQKRGVIDRNGTATGCFRMVIANHQSAVRNNQKNKLKTISS